MQTVITILTVLNMYLNVLQDSTTNYLYNANIENGILKTMYVYERNGTYMTPKLSYHFNYDEQGRLTEKTTYKWDSWSSSYKASHRLQMTYNNEGYELSHSTWNNKEKNWKEVDEKVIYKSENGQLASVEYLQIDKKGNQRKINNLIVSSPFDRMLLAGDASNHSNH